MKLGIIGPRVLIRRALSTLLASTGVALVVLEGNSINEIYEEIRQSQPDILLVDACEPQGVEGLSDLSKLGLSPRVVVLMDELDHEACTRAFQLSAWGCLSTNDSPMVFQKALTAVAGGQRWMSQQASNQMMEDLMHEERPVQEPPEELTPREWEVLGLLANGFRNKEISGRLSISEETAKSHVKAIYRKLNIKARREAIFRYFEHVHRPVDKEDTTVAGPDARASSISPHTH